MNATLAAIILIMSLLVLTAGCVSQRGGDSGIDQVADIYGTTPPPDAGDTGTAGGAGDNEGIQKQVAGIRGEIDPGAEGGNENSSSPAGEP